MQDFCFSHVWFRRDVNREPIKLLVTLFPIFEWLEGWNKIGDLYLLKLS